MFNNAMTKVISHYCIFTESNSPRLSVAFVFAAVAVLSHLGEFAAITFGKDKVLPRVNGPIVSSGTVCTCSIHSFKYLFHLPFFL